MYSAAWIDEPRPLAFTPPRIRHVASAAVSSEPLGNAERIAVSASMEQFDLAMVIPLDWSEARFGNAVRELTDQTRSELEAEIDLLESPDLIPRARLGIENCLKVVSHIAQRLTLAPDIVMGAALNDDSSVTFVAQSLKTDRRVSFTSDKGLSEVKVVRIDEHMQATHLRINPSDRQDAAAQVVWLTSGS